MSQTFLKKLLKKFLYTLLIVISLTAESLPQINPVNYKILSISVQGNKTADANTIIANSGLKVGDELQVPGDKTLTAIKQLYSLNIFSNIEIVVEKQVGDGAFLLIKVEEFPRIERVELSGYDALNEDDIREQISFIRGQILKPAEISRMKQRILNKYEEEGYLSAEIDIKKYTYFTADTTDDEITVTWRNDKDLSNEYQVVYPMDEITYSNLIEKIKDRVLLLLTFDEKAEVVVREIEFVNNEAVTDDDLKSEMDEIEEAKWWKFWSSANFDRKNFEKDKELIVKYYRKNGYRDAGIINDSLIYYNENEDMKIVMEVYEGPQYKVRNINWEGNTVYPDQALNARLDFSPGDIYDYEKFEQNLRGNEKQNDVSSLYLDNGYLTFNIRPTEIKVGEDSIDIIIRVEEKNQFKLGQVNIAGNDKTKDKVIRRELYSIPGDYFNRALLIRSIQQLANLQYFNVEKLYGAEGVEYNLANDSTVNVTFNVEEKSSDYLNASVGYSGSYGFSGAIGVTLNNFSITEPFSLGGGQILSFNWQFGVGNLYRTFSLGFTEPWFMDTPTLVGVELFDTRQAYIYDLRQSGATLRLGRRLKWPDDFFYIQGFFRYQYNNVLEGQNYYAEGETNQFTIGTTISRKDIDNPIFPSIGSNFAIDAELSGGILLPGDVDYYKLGFKAEWYRRLFGSNKLVLYTTADFGYLQELTLGTPIQPFEEYYMGGNGLVIATVPLRGYDDRTVGPRSKNGAIVGGRIMSKYTAELRFAVTLEPMPLYILAFAEAGNTWRSVNTADFFDLRRSVGFGARILINPIGLIGFDLGYGFDRMLTDFRPPEWLFHFQFGRGF